MPESRAIEIEAASGWGRPASRELVKRYGLWVHRCVSINAQAAASCTFRLFARNTGGIERKYLDGLHTIEPTRATKAWLRAVDPVMAPGRCARKALGDMDDLRELASHPILDLLHEANPWSDCFALFESVYADLQMFGRAFWHRVPGLGPLPSELWRLLPQAMKVLPSAETFVEAFEYGEGIRRKRFRPEDVIWFRLFDPGNPWGGFGPLEAWLKTIDAAINIQAFQEDLFERHGSPEWNFHSGEPWRSKRSSWHA